MYLQAPTSVVCEGYNLHIAETVVYIDQLYIRCTFDDHKSDLCTQVYSTFETP